MGERSNSLYLISGLVIGMILGVFYSLVIDPVKYYDTLPNNLDVTNKNQFRLMVARAYQSNPDLGRAIGRLTLLEDNIPAGVLAAQAQQLLSKGGSPEEARMLAILANDIELGKVSFQTGANSGEEPVGKTPTGESAISASGTQTPPASPQATFTPRVADTLLPTLISPFKMEYREMRCEPDLPQGLLQVEVLDSKGKPLPAIRVEVVWENGSDYFYTGLYPEINPGYADFEMQSQIIYSLRLENSSQVIDAIEAPLCEGKDSEDYYGGWWYRFVQQ